MKKYTVDRLKRILKKRILGFLKWFLILCLLESSVYAKITPLDVSGNYYRITSQNVYEIQAMKEERDYYQGIYEKPQIGTFFWGMASGVLAGIILSK